MDRWRELRLRRRSDSPRATVPSRTALYLRMDERAARIIVRARRRRPGPHRRLGGARPRRAGAREVRARRRRGRRRQGTVADEADERRVEEVITFDDPAGTTPSRCSTVRCSTTARSSRRSEQRFVTGEQGLGHVVLPDDRHRAGLFDFYTEVLGFLPRGAFRVPAPPEFGPMRGPLHRRQRAAPQPGDLPGAARRSSPASST